MTSKEYVIWLHGFVEACNEYVPTPKQWDTLKDKLNEVADPVSLPIGTPIGPGLGVPNTAPIQTLPFIQPYDPYNPYKITSESDTILTTSSVSSGNIIATPGYGSITYNPSTTTRWNPSGSAWSYTTTLPQQPTTGSNQLELDFEPKNK